MDHPAGPHPGAMQPAPSADLSTPAPSGGSVLDAFHELEVEQLARYCASISINGEIAQSLSVQLDRGQTMWESRGGLLAYNDRVDWVLKVPGGAGQAIGRMVAGESASLVHVTAKGPGAEAVISANQAGKLATWDLTRGPIVCTSGAFVAALGDVHITPVVARSAGAALFGGAGLFMQKLSGTGIVVVHGSGDFIERQLAPGEKLLVSTGNLAVFSGNVQYDIRSVGGCMKALFGGEGIFMTEMTGPGWVMLQSLKKLPMTPGNM